MLKKRTKYWGIFTFTIMLFSLVIYGLNSSVFIYELGLKANKYVALNVDQNWGVREKLLKTARYIFQFAPHPNTVEYPKIDTEVGIQHASPHRQQALTLTEHVVQVDNAAQLVAQFSSAKAGDTIVIEPGNYLLKDKRFKLKNAGTSSQKITLMAETFGTVTLQLDSLEGLYLAQPYWSIHNLILAGICKSDSNCEHAIHLTGDADNVEISNNRFINFNAHIKSNGVRKNFPDNVMVSGNDFYNEWPRNTKNPVTPIDVVGGNDWLISNNFIADFAIKKHDKFTVSYGAFLKGSGQRGRISGNVVNCAWHIPHQSFKDIRIGLSLGGGGTGGAFCQQTGCDYEHNKGVIENNRILNCQNDVSIYLNKASGSEVKGNIILNSLGIDARFSSTSAIIENNQYQGRIKARDGARVSEINNTKLSLGHQ
jgi:nitrous oxidase accessory protein NosD